MLEKNGKNDISMSEIGYKMFISEQTQKLWSFEFSA
jgi:hypothetical protein